jgi:hypothetical protein
MQWSKLKSRVKGLICPELRDRIDFHLTSYRESHDGADKVWITVDGKRVFSCKHYPREWAETAAFQSGLARDEIKSALAKVEIHGPGDFGDAIRSYLDMPVTDALKSPDPIVQAFAIVDRRVGKRTLASLDVSESEHTLVKTFYRLRTASARI